MTKRDQFEALRQAAEGNYQAVDALEAALENAYQTEGVEAESEEFFGMALDSLPFTAAFNESAEARGWFKDHGYEW